LARFPGAYARSFFALLHDVTSVEIKAFQGLLAQEGGGPALVWGVLVVVGFCWVWGCGGGPFGALDSGKKSRLSEGGGALRQGVRRFPLDFLC